jgi:hypothetical protein
MDIVLIITIALGVFLGNLSVVILTDIIIDLFGEEEE